MESGFVKVTKTSEVPLGTMKAVQAAGKEVLIVNVNGSYYATDLKCPHMSGDLSKGTLEGNIVICPRHHAKFNLTNGKVVAPPKVGLFHPKIKDLTAYTVKVENEEILIKL